MSKTKQRIKEKALGLFNEHGVEVITTRHVASALNMSQGNLHYHFSGRNQLIQALYDDFKLELEKSKVFRGQEFALQDLKVSIEHHFDLMWRYRFLLRDRESVWRRLPRVKRETKVFIRQTSRRVLSLMNIMREAGLMDRWTEGQLLAFLDSQIVFLMGWVHAMDFSTVHGHAFAMHQAHVFMRLWMPMFLPIGRTRWEEIMV